MGNTHALNEYKTILNIHKLRYSQAKLMQADPFTISANLLQKITKYT